MTNLTPFLAQFSHSFISSTHFGFFHTPVANLRSCIHLVAVHLVPPARRVLVLSLRDDHDEK